MRSSLTVALMAVLVAPAFAQDGKVSQTDLNALGLGTMQSMTDAQGMEVRGQASAMVIGTSLVFGQMISPDTKNFITGSDVNMVQATDSDPAGGPDPAFKEHLSLLTLNLGPITDGTNTFTGALNGIAGGVGQAGGGTTFTQIPLFTYPLTFP